MPLFGNSKENKKRVLVVDDDKNMVNALRRLFKSKGYEVDYALNGYDGQMKIYGQIPHLVVIDLKMPQLDGAETLQRIRRTDELQSLKIIAISAFFGDEGRDSMLKAGANVCVDKPFDNEALLKKAEELLQGEKKP